ncbi:MAG: AzlD domain-containing protein [Anaerolineaceae bacterium]|nr:AzlD domain-containing protein [Anaerolineaceae bacterium]
MTGMWITLVIVGLLTLATRLSFIILLDKWTPPAIFTRGLRFVPLAVLSAIIFPEILIRSGALAVPPDWPRLAGAVTAALVAWRSKNIFLTIGIGMLVFYALRFFIS